METFYAYIYNKMTKYIVYMFILFLFPLQMFALESDLNAGVKALADNLYNSLHLIGSKNYPLKLVMIPLKWDKEDHWALCKVAFELLKSQISRKSGVYIIPSDEVARATSSIKIDLAKGLLKTDELLELKKFLDCDAIISGYIADLYMIININLYLWNAIDGNLVSMESVQVRKSADIVSLLKPLSEEQSIHQSYYSMKWRSETLSYRVLSLFIDDINKDGINETLVVTDNDIKVLYWDGFSFWEKLSVQYVDSTLLRRNQSNIRAICNIDSNKLCVSVPDFDASVWSLDTDNLVKVDSLNPTLLYCDDEKYIFSALKQDRNFFSGQSTYKVLKADNSRIDAKLPVDYYSIAIGNVSTVEGEEYVIIDIENRLRVYSKDLEPIWQSEKMSFGIGIAIADIDENGINEIILTSALPMGDKDYLIVMEQSGDTYAKKWESPMINGEITAVCVGDPNNDGTKDILSAIFTDIGSELRIYSGNYIRK